MRSSRVPGILWLVALACGIDAAPANGADADVILRVTSAAGEPGEEVAFEFRADAKVPLTDASVQLDLSKVAAEILRTDVEGTAAAHVIPRGIIFDPRFFKGGYRVGVRLIAGTQRSQIEAGVDIVLFKVHFRINADAPPGEYALRISSTDFTTDSTTSARVQVDGSSSLTVLPPTRPRPARGVSCEQVREQVNLVWTSSEAYETIRVLRDGTEIASLAGSAASHSDTPSPGPTSYSVMGVRDGKESLPAGCSLLVDIPRPAAITGLHCQGNEASTSLDWVNGQSYDAIELFRNGHSLAQLAGDATSFEDPHSTDLFTVYTLRASAAGVGALPVSCTLNEQSDRYLLWAEEVRTVPGARAVPIRIFITNPQALQCLQVALRIDPQLIHMKELSVAGTVGEAAQYDYFAYQRFYVPGETAAGWQYDTIPPFGFLFPAGADQHLLTVLFDVPETTPDGTAVPLEFGVFGSPALNTDVCIRGVSIPTSTADGAILVGASPVPEVEAAHAAAPEGPAGAAQGGGGAQQQSVTLAWRNAGSYSSIRIERNGVILDQLPGDRTSYVDAAPGAGIHRYRIIARQGDVDSFPVVVSLLPRGVPGTFYRGDADGDARVSLTDAVRVVAYLFRGGPVPRCLDAADADDSGRVNVADPIAILQMLFLGAGPLPAPGPAVAWFDPTADELSCE